MKIKFIRKTDTSAGGNCPAKYEAPGGYVMQGKKLDEETLAQLRDLGVDEGAVWIPADLIDKP